MKQKLFRWAIVLALCASGCAKTSEPNTEEQSAVSIEDDYIRLLKDLTAIMAADHETPSENLSALRAYVTSSGQKAASTVNELNRAILGLDEPQREIWRKKASIRVNEALDSYAHAQLKLQKKMNETEKWELGEILSLLRKDS
ncbi:MAG: hypothetical protein IKY83_11255 [Proteobacteria bacterium]|nr:hypothetical protein [Pseudomonadota bacterium]